MKVVLRSSGDWQPEIEGVLDSGELSPELSARLEGLVKRCRGGAAAAQPGHPGAAGQMLYGVTIVPDEAEADAEEYRFDELSATPEVLDALDELMQEVIRRKRERHRRPTD